MTNDIRKERDFALAAEYALGLLTPAEARAFEDLMARDPVFREEYAVWADNFADLTNDIPEVAPPAALRSRIMKEALGDAPGAASSAARGSWLSRFGLLPSAMTGVVAAAAVLVLFNTMRVPEPAVPTAPLYTAEIAAEDQSLVVTAAFDAGSRTLTLERAAGTARDGRVLELWLIAGENPPVSLGVLPEATTAAVVLDDTLVAALEGGVLAISDEPPGGSPTGAPTGDVLAVGPVTSL